MCSVNDALNNIKCKLNDMKCNPSKIVKFHFTSEKKNEELKNFKLESTIISAPLPLIFQIFGKAKKMNLKYILEANFLKTYSFYKWKHKLNGLVECTIVPGVIEYDGKPCIYWQGIAEIDANFFIDFRGVDIADEKFICTMDKTFKKFKADPKFVTYILLFSDGTLQIIYNIQRLNIPYKIKHLKSGKVDNEIQEGCVFELFPTVNGTAENILKPIKFVSKQDVTGTLLDLDYYIKHTISITPVLNMVKIKVLDNLNDKIQYKNVTFDIQHNDGAIHQYTSNSKGEIEIEDDVNTNLTLIGVNCDSCEKNYLEVKSLEIT